MATPILNTFYMKKKSKSNDHSIGHSITLRIDHLFFVVVVFCGEKSCRLEQRWWIGELEESVMKVMETQKRFIDGKYNFRLNQKSSCGTNPYITT